MPIKENYSMEYIAFSILNYLIKRKGSAPVSKYHVMSRARIPTQRADRLNTVFDLLLKKGFVSRIKTEHTSFYKITEEGEKEYNRWIKYFLQFAQIFYQT
jgi:predicted transcriptional regulator